MGLIGLANSVLPVWLFSGMGTGINVSGKLEAGKLHCGDKIAVMPSGGQGLVKGELTTAHGKELTLVPTRDAAIVIIIVSAVMLHVSEWEHLKTKNIYLACDEELPYLFVIE